MTKFVTVALTQLREKHISRDITSTSEGGLGPGVPKSLEPHRMRMHFKIS